MATTIERFFGSGVLKDIVANYRSGARPKPGNTVTQEGSAIAESTARRVLDTLQSGPLEVNNTGLCTQ
eukprot:3316593-Amphidinium_carterae.1